MTTENEGGPTVASLLDGFEEMIQMAETAADGHDSAEAAIDHLDDVHDVIENVEELLETVDVTSVLDGIDWEQLPEAIKLSDVPDAIEERNPGVAVQLRKLLSVTDMPDVWESVDARAFWRQSRELDDELDDLSDGADESDDGDFFSDGDGSDDGTTSVASDGSLSGLGPDDDGFDQESLENAIQSQISESVREFRESILEARSRLQQVVESNRDQSERRQMRETNSRNPTAVSTLPARESGAGRAAYSTVPEETRYSTAPNRRRIYGSRFEDGEDDA